MEKQSIALAEGVGLNVVRKHVTVRQPWRSLPPRAWLSPLHAVGAGSDSIAPPWPDLLISTGGRVVALAAAVRRRSNGKTCTVQIQSPRIPPTSFDLVVAPRHDRMRGPNILETHGSLHAVTPAALAAAKAEFAHLAADFPRPIVAAMLGGNSRRHRFTTEAAETIGRSLALLATNGAGMLVTASRRTPDAAVQVVREHLAETQHYFWDGTGDNPYLGFLALADALVVTNDSVNMISEAAATGKPVHVAALPGGSTRFNRFLHHMQALGITRPFMGDLEDWSYSPPDDMDRAVAAVNALLSGRR